MSSRHLLVLLALGVLGCDGRTDPDAGGTDGGVTDAGSTDASSTDAARPDGATPDDAGPPGDGGPPVDAGPATAPGVRWVGRYDDADPSAVRMSWSGSGFVVRFRGTGARVTMNGAGQYFTVVVDGEVQPTLAVSGASGTYDLATGLADAEHTVEVYRRTEGFFGVTVVTAVEVDGELLGVPVSGRRIEVVGDSISCGYGVDGPDQFCSFSAETENHYLTYGARAARALDAELSTVAWSGKGVIFNYGTDTVEPLPTLYDRVIADEAGSTGTIRPADAVVVNLGTNDFSTDGDPTEGQFVPAYVGLLEQIRARHPDAVILCTVGPPLGADDMSRARSYIESAIAMRNTAGDARVSWIDVDGSGDLGCDWHPGPSTQAMMADDVIAALRAELGW
ncbi:MAG: hypothetical protein KC619_05075 [Myxococcales bacterium]|nr:hypothetical protein [Myxococcales bacterium]